MVDPETLKRYNADAKKLEGLTIVNCRYRDVPAKEHMLVIELSDGTMLVPLKDAAANGFGHLDILNNPHGVVGLPVLR